MGKSVEEILRVAAERSARRATLETARVVVERNLGHELADDEFGWLSVLPMPYSILQLNHA